MSLGGYLRVKSSGFLKSWKQKYYELRGGQLYYAKSSGRSFSGSIALDECVLHVGGPKNRFTLVNATRKYEFQAESELYMETWVKALKKWVREVKAELPESGSPQGESSEPPTPPPSASPQRAQHQDPTSDADSEVKRSNPRHTECLYGDGKPSIEDYELLALLGKGTFGKVLKVKKKETGELLALKIMRKDTISKPKEVMSERLVLERVDDHPFLVKLVNAFQTKSKLFLVMTYLPGGDLKHHLRDQDPPLFPEARACFYASNIVLALEALHERHIIYRDLKPDNLVLDEHGYASITDMGLARELKGAEAYTFCGTPLYVAPEVLRSVNSDQGYTQAVDWWSFGIILYEMLVGITPFYAKTAPQVFRLITTQPPIIPSVLSPNAQSLLNSLLQKDPADRLANPAEIRRHPFFGNLDWDKVLRRQYSVPGGFVCKKVVGEVLTEQQKRELLKDIHSDMGTHHASDAFKGFTYDPLAGAQVRGPSAPPRKSPAAAAAQQPSSEESPPLAS